MTFKFFLTPTGMELNVRMETINVFGVYEYAYEYVRMYV